VETQMQVLAVAAEREKVEAVSSKAVAERGEEAECDQAAAVNKVLQVKEEDNGLAAALQQGAEDALEVIEIEKEREKMEFSETKATDFPVQPPIEKKVYESHQREEAFRLLEEAELRAEEVRALADMEELALDQLNKRKSVKSERFEKLEEVEQQVAAGKGLVAVTKTVVSDNISSTGKTCVPSLKALGNDYLLCLSDVGSKIKVVDVAVANNAAEDEEEERLSKDADIKRSSAKISFSSTQNYLNSLNLFENAEELVLLDVEGTYMKLAGKYNEIKNIRPTDTKTSKNKVQEIPEAVATKVNDENEIQEISVYIEVEDEGVSEKIVQEMMSEKDASIGSEMIMKEITMSSLADIEYEKDNKAENKNDEVTERGIDQIHKAISLDPHLPSLIKTTDATSLSLEENDAQAEAKRIADEEGARKEKEEVRKRDMEMANILADQANARKKAELEKQKMSTFGLLSILDDEVKRSHESSIDIVLVPSEEETKRRTGVPKKLKKTTTRVFRTTKIMKSFVLKNKRLFIAMILLAAAGSMMGGTNGGLVLSRLFERQIR